jgi:hypothetical protein
MRAGALAQFSFGLGEADIDADLAVIGAREQELQRDGGFSGAGAEARRLASEVTDKLAREGLLQHAAEFEHRADDLEARLAVLKAAHPTGDMAAMQPPDAEPEDKA